MTCHDIALRLKGSVGSFRPLNDKPGFTLDFARFKTGQRFHGLRRIHLNNSVEDPSFCNQKLGSELFLQAGVPAPRVGYALVTLNGRRLGIYVLVEGFTEDFLSCHFNKPSGNLFEPDEGHDVNQRLKRTSIYAPKGERTALDKLSAAAQEPDLERRWERLMSALDIERFLPFMAMEVMLCHRDGYCLARNNFRIYEENGNHKTMFFPHGMDQLFGSADLPWQPHMAGLVAKAVLETPEGKRHYHDCFSVLFTNVFQTTALKNLVDQQLSQLRPFVPKAEFSKVQIEADSVKERINQRWQNLARQLGQPDLKPMEFHDGAALLGDWAKIDQPGSGEMERRAGLDGKQALYIRTASETFASWRAKALLGRGRYRFEGRASIAGIKPLSSGSHQGAGIRVAGSARQSENLVGDSAWRRLDAEFEVNEAEAEVEFICELRATAGEVWFDSSSLRVVKLP